MSKMSKMSYTVSEKMSTIYYWILYVFSILFWSSIYRPPSSNLMMVKDGQRCRKNVKKDVKTSRFLKTCMSICPIGSSHVSYIIVCVYICLVKLSVCIQNLLCMYLEFVVYVFEKRCQKPRNLKNDVPGLVRWNELSHWIRRVLFSLVAKSHVLSRIFNLVDLDWSPSWSAILLVLTRIDRETFIVPSNPLAQPRGCPRVLSHRVQPQGLGVGVLQGQ